VGPFPPIPSDWIVLSREETDKHIEGEHYHYSTIKCAVLGPQTIGLFYASCWLSEGATDWSVDPDAGISLSIQEYALLTEKVKAQ
jgi:hypothetical protein